MKISYYLAVGILSLYLCSLNFVFLDYIYTNAQNTDNPIFLSVLISVLSFLIYYGSLLLLAPPRIFKVSGSIIIILTSACAYFMSKYGVILDRDMILNVFETDSKEAFSYINFSLISWIFLTIILPICIIYIMKLSYKKGTKLAFIRTFSGVFVILILLGAAIFINSQSIIPFFRNNNLSRQLNVPFYPIYSFVKAIKSTFQKPKELEIITTDMSVSKNDKQQLLVFILGETARSKNYKALGYTKNNTNEFTQKFIDSGNMAYFDMTSCGTATITSVPCMFSHTSKSDYSPKIFAENAIDFLNKANIKTYWVGNNTGGCKGVCDRISNISLNSQFDTALLEHTKKFINELQGDGALFLHLQGSHGPTYFQRYPKEFAKFTPTCDTSELSKCSEDEIINTYDNTILFTDFIISEIIKQLEEKPSISSSLIYVSDHGESLGENGIYLHGLPYILAPDAQKQVPMAFYSNDKEKVASIKQNEKFTHDNLFHTLLGLFNINTKYYNEKLDMFLKNQ